MKWSEERPTKVPGWYWMQGEETPSYGEVVYVTKEGLAYRISSYRGDKAKLAVKGLSGYRWAGPIERPEGVVMGPGFY